jgi:hypothetical protein
MHMVVNSRVSTAIDAAMKLVLFPFASHPHSHVDYMHLL